MAPNTDAYRCRDEPLTDVQPQPGGRCGWWAATNAWPTSGRPGIAANAADQAGTGQEAPGTSVGGLHDVYAAEAAGKRRRRTSWPPTGTPDRRWWEQCPSLVDAGTPDARPQSAKVEA